MRVRSSRMRACVSVEMCKCGCVCVQSHVYVFAFVTCVWLRVWGWVGGHHVLFPLPLLLGFLHSFVMVRQMFAHYSYFEVNLLMNKGMFIK